MTILMSLLVLFLWDTLFGDGNAAVRGYDSPFGTTGVSPDSGSDSAYDTNRLSRTLHSISNCKEFMRSQLGTDSRVPNADIEVFCTAYFAHFEDCKSTCQRNGGGGSYCAGACGTETDHWIMKQLEDIIEKGPSTY